ncbi:MAG: EF-hand domain-containing protein [Pseudomonadota bacterium]
MNRKLCVASTALALVLGACASSQSPSPERGQPGQPMRPMAVFAPVALVLSNLDADQDAQLTRAELDGGIGPLFDSADANGDGALSRPELSAFSLAHLGSAFPVPGRIAFDPDQNASTSPEEFRSVFERAFDRFDTNGDGIVTRPDMLIEFNPAERRARGGGERRQAGGRGRRPGMTADGS